MKSLNNIIKKSQRRKLKNTRKRNNNKTNKKAKKGGDPTIFAEKSEYRHRINIGSLIEKLRIKIKEGINDTNLEEIKKLFSRLITMVFIYRNIYTDDLTFQKYNELYREHLYYQQEYNNNLDLFFNKYNNFNNLLDRIENDYHLETDFYRNKYLSHKKTDGITQIGNDNNDNNDNDITNNLESPLLTDTNNKKSSEKTIWQMLGL